MATDAKPGLAREFLPVCAEVGVPAEQIARYFSADLALVCLCGRRRRARPRTRHRLGLRPSD